MKHLYSEIFQKIKIQDMLCLQENIEIYDDR
jgi:hypothetical protein